MWNGSTIFTLDNLKWYIFSFFSLNNGGLRALLHQQDEARVKWLCSTWSFCLSWNHLHWNKTQSGSTSPASTGANFPSPFQLALVTPSAVLLIKELKLTFNLQYVVLEKNWVPETGGRSVMASVAIKPRDQTCRGKHKCSPGPRVLLLVKKIL